MDYDEIILLGANHEVVDALRDHRGPIRVFDDDLAVGSCGHIDAAFDEPATAPGKKFWVINGVCSTPLKRELMDVRIRDGFGGFSNVTMGPLVAPSAVVSRRAGLGLSTLVLDQAYVGPGAVLGYCSAVLPAGKVTHDCRIGCCAIVAAGAVVLGRSTIEPRAHVCANATVLPGGIIGSGACLGAGCVASNMKGNTMIVWNGGRRFTR